MWSSALLGKDGAERGTSTVDRAPTANGAPIRRMWTTGPRPTAEWRSTGLSRAVPREVVRGRWTLRVGRALHGRAHRVVQDRSTCAGGAPLAAGLPSGIVWHPHRART